MRPWRHGERGIALLSTILIMMLISGMGASLLIAGMSEFGAADNYRVAKEAFFAADSGLQQSLIDFAVDNTWAPSVVDASSLPIIPVPQFPNSISINNQLINLGTGGGGPAAQFYDLGAAAPIANATFSRQVFLPPTGYLLANGKGSKIWVQMPSRSTGTAGANDPATQVVQADTRVLLLRVHIWDNAIFAGGGQQGNQINGNVQVRGSIHVVGDPNNPTSLNWGGNSMMLNHYLGAADKNNLDADAWKLPPLPTRLIDGELVETLDAEFRLKHGDIAISGSVELGETNQTGNLEKETLDGFYVDGQVSQSGAAAISADETGEYDLTNVNVDFPTLSDPYFDAGTGVNFATHRGYLMSNSVLLPYDKLSDQTPAFDVDDGNGNRARWDPKKSELLVEGVARVEGTLEMGRKGGKNPGRIEYRGAGTLYATNDINIHWDVVPQGDYLSASGSGTMHNLGLIADTNIGIATGPGDSWIKLFAAVYAEETIKVAKQTRVAGAMVSTSFDLGTNVPRVFQVPRLAGQLPPSMPGANPLLYVSRAEARNWTHLRR